MPRKSILCITLIIQIKKKSKEGDVEMIHLSYLKNERCLNLARVALGKPSIICLDEADMNGIKLAYANDDSKVVDKIGIRGEEKRTRIFLSNYDVDVLNLLQELKQKSILGSQSLMPSLAVLEPPTGFSRLFCPSKDAWTKEIPETFSYLK